MAAFIKVATTNELAPGQAKKVEVNGKTIADSINVDLPRDGRRAVRSIRETKGESLIVSDDEILDAMRVLARGNRLSITPVEPQEWAFINATLLGPEPSARVPRKA